MGFADWLRGLFGEKEPLGPQAVSHPTFEAALKSLEKDYSTGGQKATFTWLQAGKVDLFMIDGLIVGAVSSAHPLDLKSRLSYSGVTTENEAGAEPQNDAFHYSKRRSDYGKDQAVEIDSIYFTYSTQTLLRLKQIYEKEIPVKLLVTSLDGSPALMELSRWGFYKKTPSEVIELVEAMAAGELEQRKALNLVGKSDAQVLVSPVSSDPFAVNEVNPLSFHGEAQSYVLSAPPNTSVAALLKNAGGFTSTEVLTALRELIEDGKMSCTSIPGGLTPPKRFIPQSMEEEEEEMPTISTEVYLHLTEEGQDEDSKVKIDSSVEESSHVSLFTKDLEVEKEVDESEEEAVFGFGKVLDSNFEKAERSGSTAWRLTTEKSLKELASQDEQEKRLGEEKELEALIGGEVEDSPVKRPSFTPTSALSTSLKSPKLDELDDFDSDVYKDLVNSNLDLEAELKDVESVLKSESESYLGSIDTYDEMRLDQTLENIMNDDDPTESKVETLDVNPQLLEQRSVAHQDFFKVESLEEERLLLNSKRVEVLNKCKELLQSLGEDEELRNELLATVNEKIEGALSNTNIATSKKIS